MRAHTHTHIHTVKPQRIFDTPVAPYVSSTTSFVTWPHPGGDVSNFIIEYKLRQETWTNHANVFTVSVPGNRLNTTIEDLEPAFTYDLRILVNTSLGMSVFSPVLSFTTARELFANLHKLQRPACYSPVSPCSSSYSWHHLQFKHGSDPWSDRGADVCD